MSHVALVSRLASLAALLAMGLLGWQQMVHRRADETPLAAVQRSLATGPIQQISLPLDGPINQSGGSQSVGWTSLVDLPWREASTGWQALADFDTPLIDSSFTWEPMVIAGEVFDRGIATYPFSEIVYDLDDNARRFTSRVGITDDSKRMAGSARFQIYGDEFLLYDSGLVRAGERAGMADVGIGGLRSLRLLMDDAGDGSLGDYGLWADPRLLASAEPLGPSNSDAIARAREERATVEAPLRGFERERLADIVSRAGTTLDEPRPAASGRFDSVTSLLTLQNRHLLVTVGFGEPSNGRIDVIRRGDELPTLVGVTPTLVTTDGRRFSLAELRPLRSDSFQVERLDDPIEGAGIAFVSDYSAPDSHGTVKLTVIVFDDQPALKLSIDTEGLPLRSIHYADAESASIVLGDDVRYLTDRSHLYQGTAYPDGHLRRAPLEATKPAIVGSAEAGRGILLSLFDYVPSPTWITLRRQPSTLAASIGIELEAILDDFGPTGNSPPPLTIELLDGAIGADSFTRFRRITSARYPVPPWPDNARYQWGSWYAFGPAPNESLMLKAVDLLAQYLGDLGPWQVVIDAGWQPTYAREDAELGVVDRDKFPRGIRVVSDAAHDRGMALILYLGTGFIHDGSGDGGEWLALRGLIEKHPEWMIPFQPEPSTVQRFLLDYRNPEVKAYIINIVREFFQVHGVDGISSDGLADAEGGLIPRTERDTPGGPAHPLLPALDIYQMVHEAAAEMHPNPYIETEWVNPTASNPYAHSFRYGDEVDLASWPYPFGGLLEKLDYALFSGLALGQRAFLGTLTVPPTQPHSRWWLQAAAALGTQATISLRLDGVEIPEMAAIRSDLVAIDPHKGTTTYGPGLFPETFATQRGGLIYLGTVNREHAARQIRIDPGSLGLDPTVSYMVYDVARDTAFRASGQFSLDVPKRTFRLLVLRADPGVVWTDSVATLTSAPGGLVFQVSGPAEIPGTLRAATPRPTQVLIDGSPLARAAADPRDGQYAYDDESGLLRVSYDHRPGGRRVEVRWVT
ncbi:MAG: Alpha-galactosidase [Chloroflexi bacterium]|nr:Alpha-galactosidase [Chloroflexota bacterium]